MGWLDIFKRGKPDGRKEKLRGEYEQERKIMNQSRGTTHYPFTVSQVATLREGAGDYLTAKGLYKRAAYAAKQIGKKEDAKNYDREARRIEQVYDRLDDEERDKAEQMAKENANWKINNSIKRTEERYLKQKPEVEYSQEKSIERRLKHEKMLSPEVRAQLHRRLAEMQQEKFLKRFQYEGIYERDMPPIAKHYALAGDTDKAKEIIIKARKILKSEKPRYDIPMPDGKPSVPQEYYAQLDKMVGEVESILNKKKPHKNLEGLSDSAKVTAIASLGLSIFFLSSNVTGNTIGNLTNFSSNILGEILFIIGILTSLIFLRNKR